MDLFRSFPKGMHLHICLGGISLLSKNLSCNREFQKMPWGVQTLLHWRLCHSCSETASCHILNTTIKSLIQSPSMSTEIHYLPRDLGKCTTSCTAPSTAKGGVLHKERSQTRPKTTGASHTLLVADPYRAVLSQTANLPASRERQTNILVMAHCGGHTKPVLFQDKTTEAMKHGSGFTNLQSLMSQFCITPGLVLHGELPEATIPLPTPGMPSRPLSCALSRSWRVTQLSSLMEIIPAAQVHKISLSIETHTYLRWAESPCGHTMTVHCVKKGRKRNPWGMVG